MDEYPSHRSMRGKIATGLIIALGMLIALAGVAIDYILPGTSPGLNLPQLLIIAAGLTVSIGALWFRRSRTRQRTRRSFGKATLSAIVITVVTLLALEVVLAVWGMPTYFPVHLPERQLTPLNVTTCDSSGCHFLYDEVLEACAAKILTDRICAVNRQGYVSSRDFVALDRYDAASRILMLGDSFTYGSSADLGKSYVEKLESEIPEATIWNTGAPGTGTNQALMSFDSFAPMLKPHLTVLGFVTNDFYNNLIPVESWIRVKTADNVQTNVYYYYNDTWGNVFGASIETALRYAGHTVGPARNAFEHSVGTTRLGTLVLRLRDSVGTLSGMLWRKQKTVTRQYLERLRDHAHAQDTVLLVLLVPNQEDIEVPGELYETSIQLLSELQMPYLEVRHVLDSSTDFALPPDNHWNTTGHQKVGAFLSECIVAIIANGNLNDCDYVVVP